jgi:hypothetical protein
MTTKKSNIDNEVVGMTEQGRNRMDGIGVGLALKFIEKSYNVNAEASSELNKCDTFEFDVFKVRELTNGNELAIVLSYILTKRKCL